MRKLIKGQEVIIVRNSHIVRYDFVAVERRIVESSGPKRTRLVNLHMELDTDSLTRTIEEIEASNIVGHVIVSEEHISRVLAHIEALRQRSIAHRTAQLKESPGNKRLQRSLDTFSKPLDIHYGDNAQDLKPTTKEEHPPTVGGVKDIESEVFYKIDGKVMKFNSLGKVRDWIDRAIRDYKTHEGFTQQKREELIKDLTGRDILKVSVQTVKVHL